jgi:rhodanese-related sulfurtransferase
MAAESTIDRLVRSTRRRLGWRPGPAELGEVAAAGGLVVDIRPSELRDRDGDLPGAVVVERNVLEWRLDPTSPHRIHAARSRNQLVVVVCDEGYASTLAAMDLRRIGLHRATDLDGGFQAWRSHVDGSGS